MTLSGEAPPVGGKPVPGTYAVVGLGNMGGGMAASLARSGYEVFGVDPGLAPTPEGVSRVDLLPALERARVVVLSLPGEDHVAEVLTGSRGLLGSGAATGVLVVDTSTCSPDRTRELAAPARRRRTHARGRPGQRRRHRRPTGRPHRVSRLWRRTSFPGAQAALAPLTATVHHVGDTGAGQATKLDQQPALRHPPRRRRRRARPRARRAASTPNAC